MKKLIFFLSIVFLFSCKKDQASVTIPTEPDVIFYASGQGYKISGLFGTYTIMHDPAIPNPHCFSYWSPGSRYLITYLKGGVYNVTIYATTLGDVVFTITVYEDYCNAFDVSNPNYWQ
jgi:hypothetical protein